MSSSSARSTAARTRPPLDGSLSVIAGYVDWQAEFNPAEPCVVFPRPDDPNDILAITYAEFAKATHRVAHVVRPGRSGQDGEVVALLLNCDTMLYQAMLVGLMRAGVVPFPLSPRNTPEATYYLLKTTNSHRIISQPSMQPLVSVVTSLAAKDGHRVQIEELPALLSIYPSLLSKRGQDSPAVFSYPTAQRCHEPDDLVFYLHSSGSTGPPKAIPQTQRRALEWSRAIGHTGNLPDSRFATMGLPTFHAMGVSLQLFIPFATSQSIAVFPPQSPASPTVPNPQNILDLIKATGCTMLPTIPAFLEVWTHSKETMEILASLAVVLFAGGPLSRSTGDKLIAAGVNIRSVYGATEIAGSTLLYDADAGLEPTPDWEWLQFPSFMNLRWDPQGDGTYELQVLVNSRFHPAVEDLPDVRGYSTKDLFVQHPTNPKLWKIVGRLDDVIMLGSAEKIVPIAQEGYMQSLSFMNGAVMFGRGRSQPGILLEPKPEFSINPKDHDALARFRNKVWPYIEEANKLGPQFARIFKETILVANPKEPLARSAKGTIRRRATLDQYAREIDELYNTLQESIDDHGVSAPESWSPEAVETWLFQHATAINAGKVPSASVDLFEQGFDSLSATYLRNRIIGAFRSSPDPFVQAAASSIPTDIVFANPTIQWLSHVVSNLADPSSTSGPSKSLGLEIEDMIVKYTNDLPTVKGKKPIDPSTGVVIVLTGSTGALGSHLLADLLANEQVEKVYTLDRAEHIRVRQKLAFKERGLPVKLLQSDKLSALTVNTNRADLGLGAGAIAEVKGTLTHVIHNAWRVDFNLSLGSFESNIAYTRRLVDLSASSPNAARFFFTSSVSAAARWDTSQGSVPEYINEDSNTAAPFGYGSSKYVVERILANAADKGLPAMSIRIGQISGATTTGAWNTSDWVPILVKSSLTMGSLPALNENVSWLPMDVASQTIVDFVFSCRQHTPPVLVNLVHPRSVSWMEVFEGMNDALPNDRLEFIPFSTWSLKLEALSANNTERDLEKIPAIKALSFLRQYAGSRVPTFDTTKAQSLSQTLRGVEPIGRRDAALWIRYWRNQGMLD